MRSPVAMPVAATRNPFAGKGLAVTIELLLLAPAAARLVDLAAGAEVSPAHVTRAVRALRAADLVVGTVSQGREGSVAATDELFWRTSSIWPAAAISLQGGSPPDDRPVGGGPVATDRFELSSAGPPCVYVRHQDELPGLVALTGGALVSESVAEWQVAVVDYPFAPGPFRTSPWRSSSGARREAGRSCERASPRSCWRAGRRRLDRDRAAAGDPRAGAARRGVRCSRLGLLPFGHADGAGARRRSRSPLLREPGAGPVS